MHAIGPNFLRNPSIWASCYPIPLVHGSELSPTPCTHRSHKRAPILGLHSEQAPACLPNALVIALDHRLGYSSTAMAHAHGAAVLRACLLRDEATITPSPRSYPCERLKTHAGVIIGPPDDGKPYPYFCTTLKDSSCQRKPIGKRSHPHLRRCEALAVAYPPAIAFSIASVCQPQLGSIVAALLSQDSPAGVHMRTPEASSDSQMLGARPHTSLRASGTRCISGSHSAMRPYSLRSCEAFVVAHPPGNRTQRRLGWPATAEPHLCGSAVAGYSRWRSNAHTRAIPGLPDVGHPCLYLASTPVCACHRLVTCRRQIAPRSDPVASLLVTLVSPYLRMMARFLRG